MADKDAAPTRGVTEVAVRRDALRHGTIRGILFDDQGTEVPWDALPAYSSRNPHFAAKVADGTYWAYIVSTYPSQAAWVEAIELVVTGGVVKRGAWLQSEGWWILPFAKPILAKIPPAVLAAVRAWEERTPPSP